MGVGVFVGVGVCVLVMFEVLRKASEQLTIHNRMHSRLNQLQGFNKSVYYIK